MARQTLNPDATPAPSAVVGPRELKIGTTNDNPGVVAQSIGAIV